MTIGLASIELEEYKTGSVLESLTDECAVEPVKAQIHAIVRLQKTLAWPKAFELEDVVSTYYLYNEHKSCVNDVPTGL